MSFSVGTTSSSMRLKVTVFLLTLLCCSVLFTQAARVKDITQVKGIRDNQLQGIGLVTGLAGTGDQDLEMTNQSLRNLLREYGLNFDIDDVESENTSLVMVTGTIDAFARQGDQIDVNVSSIGDAESLQGGTLAQTPLQAANGQTYAVAQGPIAVGGFIGGEQGDDFVQRNHPTSGILSDGAIVERNINTQVLHNNAVDFKLINPDFTTAVRMADAINQVYPASAQAIDAKTVNVRVPQTFSGQVPNFIAAVEGIDTDPDVSARIVINERTGTIIATENVSISPVAISYGGLTIEVAQQEEQAPNQPLAEANQPVQNEQVNVEEEQGKFAVVPDPTQENPSIQDLADGLNSLGVTTRDMVNILQTLKDSGALHAEIKIQ